MLKDLENILNQIYQYIKINEIEDHEIIYEDDEITIQTEWELDIVIEVLYKKYTPDSPISCYNYQTITYKGPEFEIPIKCSDKDFFNNKEDIDRITNLLKDAIRKRGKNNE